MSETTRKHEFAIEIAAPPELVWKTISEGEGLTRWFAPEARVEPGAGGSIWVSWGPGMEGSEPIAIWDPPHHLQQLSGPKTVDYYVEAREGGGSVLRLVHSGFGAEAEFDSEYDATFGGWSMFLATLKFGLDRHAGEPHRNVTVFRMLTVDQTQAWSTLTGDGGFHTEPAAGQLREGEAYQGTLPWGERIHGNVVRKPKPYGYLSVSVAEWNNAALGFFAESCGGAVALTVMCILFGDATAGAEELRSRLTEAVSRLFSEPAVSA